MTFTIAQTKVLKNLEQYAERKFHVTPEYQAACFEHVLGIYIEFGAYRVFDAAIDTYNGTHVGAFHDFSQQMFMFGICCDDFRLPELLAIVAKELRGNPTGPLSVLLHKGKGKFYDAAPPHLMGEDGVVRFNLDDYLDVYRASVERYMPTAAADPEQHEALVILLNAIKGADRRHFEGIAAGLHYVIYKHGFAYDNIFRQAVLGADVDTQELLGRLNYILTKPAEAESGDFSLAQANGFLSIVDAQISRHGVAAKQFNGNCSWLIQASANSAMNRTVHSKRHSALLLYLTEELETRGFDFEWEVIVMSMDYVHSLSFKQMEMSTEHMSREDHLYLQKMCTLAGTNRELDTPEGRLTCLAAAYSCAKNGSPWLSQFLGRLIDRIDPRVAEQADLGDLECMGLYRHTGNKRYLQQLKSEGVRDRVFGADLGI